MAQAAEAAHTPRGGQAHSALYATRSGGIGVLWESQGDVPLSQCNDTGVFGNESGKPGACQIRLSIVNT